MNEPATSETGQIKQEWLRFVRELLLFPVELFWAILKAVPRETIINKGTVSRSANLPKAESNTLAGRVRQFRLNLTGTKKVEIRDTTGKWRSINIMNDNPSGNDAEILIYVNRSDESKPIAVKRSETVEIKFDEPVIERVYASTEDGATATGRIFGKY